LGVIRDPGQRRITFLAAAFFLPYAAVFTFRDAGGWDRWVPQTFALWVVVYAVGGDAPKWMRGVRYFMPLALAVFNFATAILPESRIENNEHAAYARFVATFARKGDLIINAGNAGMGSGVYSEYFAGVRTTSFHLASLDEDGLRRDVAATLAAGGAVYVAEGRPVVTSASVVSPGVGREYGADGPYARRLLRGYDWELYTTYRGKGYLPSRFWRLRPVVAGVK